MGNDHGHGGNGCKCGKKNCDGDCGCSGSTTFTTGCACPDFHRVQTVTGQNATIADNVTQVDVCGDKPVELTLPCSPRFGRTPLLINNRSTEDIAIVSEDSSISGQDENGQLVLAPGQSAILSFGRCDDDCGTWSVLLGLAVGDGGDGDGQPLIVPNIAALVAFNCAGLKEGTRVLVQTLDQFWELALTSAEPTDGITVVAAQCGGRWLRIETFSKKWSLQINWFVDSDKGNDENTGASAATPTKTVAEVTRRLHQQQAGRNYQVNLLNDVPEREATPRTFGTVLIQDRFRPSGVQEANAEDTSPTTGFEQIVNMTLSGLALLSAPAVVTGVLTAATGTAGGVQATATAAPGTLDANIGAIVVITSGANIGASAAIGANLGGGVVRTAPFFSPANAIVIPAAGSTFAVVRLTRWNAPIMQIGNSQGRYLIQNIEFPDVPLPPADQELISFRFMSLTFSRCRFRRNSGRGIMGTGVDISDYSVSAFNGCSFDYAGLTGNGIAGTVIVDGDRGETAFNGCLFLNVDLRVVQSQGAIIISCYMQNSRLTTVTPTNFTTYGFFVVPAGSTNANVYILGQGLGIYDWPVVGDDDAAIRIVNGSLCKVFNNSNLYGSNAQAGAVGVRVDGGSRFLWLTQGATAPAITGARADLILEHSNTAIPSPELFPASWTPPTPRPLTTWADWAANFARRAMNYQTSSCISQCQE